MLQFDFCCRSVCSLRTMLIITTSFISLIAFACSVTSAESEPAKVKEVGKNSTINFIKYTGNGILVNPNTTEPTITYINYTENGFFVNPDTTDSAITYINYTGNGMFIPNATVINRRVATLSQIQETSQQCGGIFRNLQNLIESPKIISPRPICNLRCEYQIVSPYICENDFHVQFLNFEIDSSRDCENDRVIINYNEVLCGKIIGVKKFRTNGGVLNITFTSRLWDLKENKNFRLLITRLPCVEDSKEDQTEVHSLEPTAPQETDEEPRCFQVNSSYSVSNPPLGQGHPIYGIPVGYNRSVVRERQDIPVLPLPPAQPINPIQPPYYPTNPTYPEQPILPPQFLPQCCRNIYNQNRFLMISQGFPAYSVLHNDCIFVIQRSSPAMCKLRIVFKYFLLDDPQPGQFGCVNSFIEIDGQRICGCKTNFVYETLWGFEPKVIRLRTVPGSFKNAQGFIFDVIQEACPFKLQESSKSLKQNIVYKPRHKRHFLPGFFIRPQSNQGRERTDFGVIPSISQFKPDIDESFKGKFFQPETNFVDNDCFMNHLKMFHLKLEYFSIVKQYCFRN